MQARLLLSATLMVAWAPLAAAQYFDADQQPQPQQPQQEQPQPAPQPQQPAKPKPAPKPKPAAVKKPAPASAPAVAAMPAALPGPAAAKARLLEKIGDWSVFIHEDTGGRVCFAASAPTDMQPKTAVAKRTPVVFYVTAWQKDGVRNEISVKLGYPVKPNSAAAVTAGGRSFTLPSDEDKAYTKDLADEQKLLAAMAGGGAMVVKATSAKGTATTDQYSLEGLAAAVQKAQQACL
jgi:hypothetical protein